MYWEGRCPVARKIHKGAKGHGRYRLKEDVDMWMEIYGGNGGCGSVRLGMEAGMGGWSGVVGGVKTVKGGGIVWRVSYFMTEEER